METAPLYQKYQRRPLVIGDTDSTKLVRLYGTFLASCVVYFIWQSFGIDGNIVSRYANIVKRTICDEVVGGSCPAVAVDIAGLAFGEVGGRETLYGVTYVLFGEDGKRQEEEDEQRVLAVELVDTVVDGHVDSSDQIVETEQERHGGGALTLLLRAVVSAGDAARGTSMAEKGAWDLKRKINDVKI